MVARLALQGNHKFARQVQAPNFCFPCKVNLASLHPSCTVQESAFFSSKVNQNLGFFSACGGLSPKVSLKRKFVQFPFFFPPAAGKLFELKSAVVTRNLFRVLFLHWKVKINNHEN